MQGIIRHSCLNEAFSQVKAREVAVVCTAHPGSPLRHRLTSHLLTLCSRLTPEVQTRAEVAAIWYWLPERESIQETNAILVLDSPPSLLSLDHAVI